MKNRFKKVDENRDEGNEETDDDECEIKISYANECQEIIEIPYSEYRDIVEQSNGVFKMPFEEKIDIHFDVNVENKHHSSTAVDEILMPSDGDAQSERNIPTEERLESEPNVSPATDKLPNEHFNDNFDNVEQKNPQNDGEQLYLLNNGGEPLPAIVDSISD